MKKIISILLVSAMLIAAMALVACGGEENNPTPTTPPTQAPTDAPTEAPSQPTEEPSATTRPAQKETLSVIMASLLEGLTDMPMLNDIEITAENFSSYAFIDPIEGAQALASEPMISSISHSVVLIRLPDGSDVEAVAESIRQNANPSKWVCVTAEKVSVVTSGNYVLLVMSSAETTDAIVANFEAYFA